MDRLTLMLSSRPVAYASAAFAAGTVLGLAVGIGYGIAAACAMGAAGARLMSSGDAGWEWYLLGGFVLVLVVSVG